MMPTPNRPVVLLGWELGGGFGHAASLTLLARRLRASGMAPVLAVKDWLKPYALLARAGCPIVPAPSAPPERYPFRARTYADVLAIRGFSHPKRLLPLVTTWQGLFDTIRPAIIVADHSPSLVLAAFGEIPTVLVGSGFTVPPSNGEEFSVLDPNAKPTATAEQVLNVVCDVQRQRNRPIPKTLPGIFSQARPFFRILPELDPYRHVRRIVDAGPLSPLADEIDASPNLDFFAYLSGEDARTGPALETLVRHGMRGAAYLRDAPVGFADKIRQLGIPVHDILPSPGEALARARVAVHHAGCGFAQDALAAGRPQLLLPRHLEQELTARALAEMGVATFAVGRNPKEQFTAAAWAVFTDDEFATQARNQARRLSMRGVEDWSDRFVEHCRDLAAIGAER